MPLTGGSADGSSTAAADADNDSFVDDDDDDDVVDDDVDDDVDDSAGQHASNDSVAVRRRFGHEVPSHVPFFQANSLLANSARFACCR